MKKVLLSIALCFSSQLVAGDNFSILDKVELNKYQKEALIEIKKENKGKRKAKLNELIEALDLTESQMKKLEKFKKNNKQKHKEKTKNTLKKLNLTDEQKSQLKGLKRLIKKED